MTLVNKIKLMAHSRGLVFVEVSSAYVKMIYQNTMQDLQHMPESAKRDFVIAIKKELSKMNSSKKWCKPTLRDDFKKIQLLQNSEAYRDDQQMVLAYQTNVEGTQIRCAGICSFGDADTSDRTFQDALLQKSVAEKHVLDIDLLCTLNDNNDKSHRGTGSLLLAYSIAKQFQRKMRGRPKYKSVVVSMGQTKEGDFPIKNILERLGFKSAPIITDPENEYEDESMMVADELRLNSLGPLETLCPTGPRSGLRYCI